MFNFLTLTYHTYVRRKHAGPPHVDTMRPALEGPTDSIPSRSLQMFVFHTAATALENRLRRSIYFERILEFCIRRQGSADLLVSSAAAGGQTNIFLTKNNSQAIEQHNWRPLANGIWSQSELPHPQSTRNPPIWVVKHRKDLLRIVLQRGIS